MSNKVTKEQLRQIIVEEISALIETGELDEAWSPWTKTKARAKGLGSQIGSTVKGGALGLGAKAAQQAAKLGGMVGGEETAATIGATATKLQRQAAQTKQTGTTKAQQVKAQTIIRAHIKDMLADLKAVTGFDIADKQNATSKKVMKDLQASLYALFQAASGPEEIEQAAQYRRGDFGPQAAAAE